MKKAWVYVLKCRDESHYTGYTTDLDARLDKHNRGEACNYTADRLPVELVYTCEYPSIKEAFARERQIKGWTRVKKEALKRGDTDALVELSKSRLSSQEE